MTSLLFNIFIVDQPTSLKLMLQNTLIIRWSSQYMKTHSQHQVSFNPIFLALNFGVKIGKWKSMKVNLVISPLLSNKVLVLTQVTFNNILITPTTLTTKYFGIHFDKKLTWIHHITTLNLNWIPALASSNIFWIQI